MVPRSSAIIGRKDVETIMPMDDRDHVGMCKFRPNDYQFEEICKKLNEYVKELPKKTQGTNGGEQSNQQSTTAGRRQRPRRKAADQSMDLDELLAGRCR